jgi:hypothetical protein
MDRREFTRNVGLFAGFVAVGSPGLAKKPLIVTPADYQRELGKLGQMRPGQVAYAAVLDGQRKVMGTTQIMGEPTCLVNDTLEVRVPGTHTCSNCGAARTLQLDFGSWSVV